MRRNNAPGGWHRSHEGPGRWRGCAPGWALRNNAETRRHARDFLNGDCQGHGIFIFVNGDRYEGSFKGGLPNGFGSFTSHTGESVRGSWSNGCLRQGDRVTAAGISKEKCAFEESLPIQSMRTV